MKMIILSITVMVIFFGHAEILNNGDKAFHTPNNITRTLFPKNLHEACYNGDIAAVKKFLEQGSKPTELGGDDGRTPLHYLFTNIGVGLAHPDADPDNKKTVFIVMEIYHLLQKHTKKKLISIKDQYGQTAKEILFSETRYWCRESKDHPICKQYAELLHFFLQRDVI